MRFINSAFYGRKLFYRSFMLFNFETANLDLSDTGKSPGFHNILDRSVISFDDNVITISVFYYLCCQATVS